MTIRVLFFASYREMVGSGELRLELPGSGGTVSDLLQLLWDRGHPFDALPAAPVVAVNQTFATLDTPLSEGDEVAFVPPVAGG
jgi:molybdopterin converting factor subunit 1